MPRFWLLAGGLTVVIAGLLSGAAVPLYDGIGFPDEPYRPVGQAHPASITVSVGTLNGASAEALFSTDEQGPQLAVYLAPGVFKLPTGTSQITFTATPLAPSGQPKDGTVAGDVYRISAAPPAAFQPSANASSAVALRLPQGAPVVTAPVIEYKKPGGSWRQLQTLLTGTDVYKAGFAGLGDYAMVTTKSAPKSATGLKINNVTGIVGAIIVFMLGIILFLRARSRRHV